MEHIVLQFWARSANNSPNEITSYMGVNPTRTRAKGTCHAEGTSPVPINSWVLDSGVQNDRPVCEHFEALSNQLIQIGSRLTQMPEDIKCAIVIAIYSDRDNASITLDFKLLRLAEEFQIPIEIDFYGDRQSPPSKGENNSE